MDSRARRLWQLFETVHAVTYFDARSLDALREAGAQGFWMGYFAARLAPLGPVGPEVATAVCFGFSGRRPRRALPDAWSYLSPEAALAARSSGAAAALRAAVPSIDAEVGPALDRLEHLGGGLDCAGRPLAAGNRSLPPAPDPVVRLWQACTFLREHRGDAHVALVGAGLDGCEAQVLATLVHGQDPEVLQDSRAWSPDEWEAATGRLSARGLVEGDGEEVTVSTGGRALHARIEEQTDALADAAYDRVADAATLDRLADDLRPIAAGAATVLPFPNAMGLPPLG